MAIKFEGDQPSELIVTRRGQAIAQGEIVKMTLPVCAPGLDAQEHEIELLFRFGHAFALSEALRDAAIEARKQAREMD